MLTTSERSYRLQRERASLDAIWARKVKARDSYRCWVCGKRATDAAHLFSKRHQATRWALDNGHALCRDCHNHYTKHDFEWKALIGRRGLAVELSHTYFADGAVYCEMAARDMATPSLFDVVEASA